MVDYQNELQLSSDLRYGPKRDRSCTDIICCMIFIAFLAFSVFLVADSSFKGDMSKIARPFDADGSLVIIKAMLVATT